MRSLLYTLLSLATFASTLAADAPVPSATADPDDLEEVVPDTVFNGQSVPPMRELREQSIDEDLSHGNWYRFPLVGMRHHG